MAVSGYDYGFAMVTGVTWDTVAMATKATKRVYKRKRGWGKVAIMWACLLLMCSHYGYLFVNMTESCSQLTLPERSIGSAGIFFIPAMAMCWGLMSDVCEEGFDR